MLYWKKGQEFAITPFSSTDLQCHCAYHDCITQKIDVDAVHFAFDAIKLARRPYVLDSAFRCEKHNKDVGGKSYSQHLRGKAFDIHTKLDENLIQLLDSFIADHGGLGLYDWGFHIDHRGVKARWDFRKKPSTKSS